MKQPKVIKRYANRKLYDTARSCYVTLDEISRMIKDGDDVKVVDNKSKDDLTAVTLAQIIVEEEKKVQKMPLKLLRSIIQSGTNSMGEAIGDFVTDRVVDPVKRIRDDAERRVDALLKRDGKDDDAAVDAKEGKPGVIQDFVAATTEAFESWQRRIDERVREAVLAALRTQSTEAGTSADQLRNKLAELEDRLRGLEQRPRP